MRIKTISDEDFLNYKKISMFIGMCYCCWKCCKEGEFDIKVCQNSPLAQHPSVNIEEKLLIKRYLNNTITQSIIFGGLEPMLQFDEIIGFISLFRLISNDDIIIYTGYRFDEIKKQVQKLRQFDNIIVKYGRFIPNHEPHYDKVLGVNLASDNQYAERIS